MKATRVNLTAVPRKFFDRDKKRGIFMLRNTHLTATMYVGFSSPVVAEGFPILAGDIMTLDRGDLTDEIYIWADVVTDLNNILIG